MNLSTVEVFAKAAELSLKLGFESPNTLTFEPADKCPPDFVEILRVHKPRLLALLQLPFVMAYSRILNETIFLCEDESTRQSLVEAGADGSAIYTRSELQILVEHNCAKPFVPNELIKLHAIKKSFNAKIR